MQKKLSEAEVIGEEERLQTEKDRKALIIRAQELYQKGLSRTEISNVLAIPIKRLRRYLSGNAEHLCKDGRSYVQRSSSLDPYREVIWSMLGEKLLFRDIHHNPEKMGVKISYSVLCKYCAKKFDAGQTVTLKNPPVRHSLSRKQIFEYIWSGKDIEPADALWLSEKYPKLWVLRSFVDTFRLAFQGAVDLEKWISDAMFSDIPAIRSFAVGLERDKDAVINAAKYQASNAFLEGNINRLKMIKRSMFGRAGLDLLSIKVIGQSARWKSLHSSCG